MYLFQQSIWLSPEQHLLQGRPAAIASLPRAAPHRPAWDTAHGTEGKGSSQNITLTQTIADN